MKFILLRFVFIVSMGLASLPVFSQEPPEPDPQPPPPPADDDPLDLPLDNNIWVLGGLAIVYAFYTNKKIGNIDS